MTIPGRTTLIAVFWALFMFAACSDCDQKTIGAKKGDALAWESIPMGIDEAQFGQAASELLGQNPKENPAPDSCRDQAHLNFPDMSDKLIVERASGGHSILNCVLKGAEGSSSTLVEVRGEFVDHRLARLTYLFAAGEFERLLGELESRFDKGLTTTFEERTPFEEVSREYRVWRFDNAIWTFYRMEEGTAALVRYELEAIAALPETEQASKRGKPVSLEDLGIGKFDLNAPEPEIYIPDSGLPPTPNLPQ
jgi:hypothetical protein